MSILMFQVEDIAALPQSLIFGQGMASEDMQITRRVIFYGGGGIRYCPSLSRHFLNKTAKSPSKREDKTRRWNIHKKIPSVFQKDCRICK